MSGHIRSNPTLGKEAATEHIEWGAISANASQLKEDTFSDITLLAERIEIRLEQDFHPQTLHNLLMVIRTHA